jgi:hypothetical protein
VQEGKRRAREGRERREGREGREGRWGSLGHGESVEGSGGTPAVSHFMHAGVEDISIRHLDLWRGVTMVLQWRCHGVTMVLQRCYNGVTIVLQWSPGDTSHKGPFKEYGTGACSYFRYQSEV